MGANQSYEEEERYIRWKKLLFGVFSHYEVRSVLKVNEPIKWQLSYKSATWSTKSSSVTVGSRLQKPFKARRSLFWSTSAYAALSVRRATRSRAGVSLWCSETSLAFAKKRTVPFWRAFDKRSRASLRWSSSPSTCWCTGTRSDKQSPWSCWSKSSRLTKCKSQEVGYTVTSSNFYRRLRKRNIAPLLTLPRCLDPKFYRKRRLWRYLASFFCSCTNVALNQRRAEDSSINERASEQNLEHEMNSSYQDQLEGFYLLFLLLLFIVSSDRTSK